MPAQKEHDKDRQAGDVVRGRQGAPRGAGQAGRVHDGIEGAPDKFAGYTRGVCVRMVSLGRRRIRLME